MEKQEPGYIGMDTAGKYWVYLGEYVKTMDASNKFHVYIYLGDNLFGFKPMAFNEDDYQQLNLEILNAVYNIQRIRLERRQVDLVWTRQKHKTLLGYPPYSRRIDDAVQCYGCKLFIPTNLAGLVRTRND